MTMVTTSRKSPVLQLLEVFFDCLLEGKFKAAREIAQQSNGRITFEPKLEPVMTVTLETRSGEILCIGHPKFKPMSLINLSFGITFEPTDMDVVRSGNGCLVTVYDANGYRLLQHDLGSFTVQHGDIFRLSFNANDS